jgi:spore germination cell wall hydrolase CwlJ-like protein
MKRIHWIIGIIVFLLMSAGATADEALTYNERIVALTILGEARGEGKSGMYAVACVIQKRMEESTVNHTAAEVCHQPYQFEVWNAGKGKVKKESKLYYLWQSNSFEYARKLSRCVCAKKLDLNYTGHANHYYSKTKKTPPYWAKGNTATKVIGNHIFFKLPWASNRK